MYIGPRNVYPMIYVSCICKHLKTIKGFLAIFSLQNCVCYQIIKIKFLLKLLNHKTITALKGELMAKIKYFFRDALVMNIDD